MGKKPKCESCSSGWCSNHVLEILPLKNADCYYRKKIKLRFCPKHNTLINSFQKTIPIINHDQKHYTPCFILQEEQNYYTTNDLKLQSTHRHKLEEDGTASIMVAKHGRRKNYCSVCRVEYEDYLMHIEDNSHRHQLRSNKFSKLIIETQHKLRDQRALLYPFVEVKVLEETNETQKIFKHILMKQV